RPPWMNLLAAYFLSLGIADFAAYQLICAFFNALVLIPSCLILPVLYPRGGRTLLLLSILLAFNPLFVQNATWTWRRLYCAFFVIAGIAFYLAAWRKNSMGRMIAAFAFMACALLIHYSAGPFVIFLAIHYLIVLFRHRPRRWQEFGTSLAAS